MNSAKEIFNSKKDLRAWWAGVCDDPRFVDVILHAKAVAFDGCPSEQERHGILIFAENLVMLSVADEEPTEYKQPGLVHNLEPKRQANEPKKK